MCKQKLSKEEIWERFPELRINNIDPDDIKNDQDWEKAKKKMIENALKAKK